MAADSLGLADEDVSFAMNMLRNQSHRCLTAQGLSGTVEPKNGLPQGSVEAPTLFAMMLEPLMREIEQKHGHLGFNLGGLRIAIQAYADDMVLISETREGMQELLKVVGDYCQFSGLEIATGRERRLRAWR